MSEEPKDPDTNPTKALDELLAILAKNRPVENYLTWTSIILAILGVVAALLFSGASSYVTPLVAMTIGPVILRLFKDFGFFGLKWTKKLFNEPRLTNIVSDLYVKDVKASSFPAYVLLSACLGFTIALREYVPALIIAVVMLGTFSFGLLTKTRVERGSFADNQYEVLELIRFIVAKSKSSGIPPGARAVRSASHTRRIEAGAEERLGSRA
jgi:hypothetical protein